MGCASCGTETNGKVTGCKSNGGCSTGGCNRMNTYDWFADIPISFNERSFNVVEISFKKGARKGYYRNINHLDFAKGDYVVVEAAQGYDIGEISLQGELVKLQMKKRKIKDKADTIRNIMRLVTPKDLEKFETAKEKEKQCLVKARVIAREMKLDMKVGDVEFQGDNKKATFYYTAEDRVDFRELVKQYAKEFKVKIEMRQIGSRQEAGRIGGIGPCGRELCCSTWLTDFKTVSTGAARYQNLSINTDKLSGQCGRLKCCLNFELDTYMDALKHIPKNADKIDTRDGRAYLRKTDIFRRFMWYTYESSNTFVRLKASDVIELIAMNKKGQKPNSILDYSEPEEEVVKEAKYEELVGQVSLKTLEKKSKKRSGKNKRKGGNNKNQNRNRNKNRGKKS